MGSRFTRMRRLLSKDAMKWMENVRQYTQFECNAIKSLMIPNLDQFVGAIPTNDNLYKIENYKRERIANPSEARRVPQGTRGG